MIGCRGQEPGAQATGRCAIAAMTLALVLLSACGSTPTYPQPAGDNGQILVQLNGEPREGAPKAKTREVRGEYTTGRQSVEQGKAFERVDYDAIEDVVVIVDAGAPVLRDVPELAPSAGEITLDDEGFNRAQYLARHRKGGASFTLHNQRKQAVHLYGFSETDDSFEAEVSAGALGTIKVAKAGRYDVYCEEDETLHCVLFAEAGPYCWIGSSDDDAFFDMLPPGEYEVHVHAPRLPAWSRKVKVTAGKRETLTAELTVNNLPKVGE